MLPILNIAVKAARSAGKMIIRAQDQVDTLTIIEKGNRDYASQIDKKAEEIIIRTIKDAYPTHGILGEESGAIDTDKADTIWIIDPLDGTTNFIHGFPQYCV